MNSTEKFRNYINGQWKNSISGKEYEVFNPADKNQLLGSIPFCSKKDADLAIDAASSSLHEWSNITAPERGEILFEVLRIMDSRKLDLAETITLEEGKVLSDSEAEVKRSMNIIQFSAGEGRRLLGNTSQSENENNVSYTMRKPLGVVGIITPWNFPLAIPSWKIAPALICGNTVIFKPAFSTPLSAIKLVEIFEEAGLPPGVINLVTGSGSEIGQSLVEDNRVQGISFTGSTEIGTKIYSDGASKLKKIQCEMGGKNAVIVLKDADIEKAAKDVVIGAFGSTGQRCTATSRVIIEQEIYEEFIAKMLIFTKDLKIGNGIDADIDIGPLSSLDQLEKVTEYIGLGVEQGGKILIGGNRLEGEIFDDGFYVEPTIFVDVDKENIVAKEEIFGPVLISFKVSDLSEALDITNDVDFGLSSSIYTKDIKQAYKYINNVDTGMVHVNSPTLGGEVHLPFGGLKSSGVGHREQGEEGFNFFSELISVYIDHS